MRTFGDIIPQFFASKKALWIIMAVAAVLRLLFLIVFDLGGAQFAQPFSGDAHEYVVAANRILAGAELEPYWPPGLPYYLSFWGLFAEIPGNGLLLKLAMLPWFGLLFWATYQVGSRLYSPKVTHFALFLLSVYPEFVHQSVVPLSQLPAAALLMTTLALILRAKTSGRITTIVLAGLVAGLLILFRPSAGLLLPVLAIWGWGSLDKGREFVGYVTGAMILPIIWIVFVHGQTGRWMYINDANARNFFLGNNEWTPQFATWKQGSQYKSTFGEQYTRKLTQIEALPPKKQADAYQREAFAYIQAAPGRFLARTGNRITTFWAFDTFSAGYISAHYDLQGTTRKIFPLFWVFMGIMLFGLIILGWLKAIATPQFWRFEEKKILWLLALYALPYAIAFSHPVYHLPVLPLFFLVGAAALGKSAHSIQFTWKRGLTFLLFAGFMLWTQVRWGIFLWNEWG